MKPRQEFASDAAGEGVLGRGFLASVWLSFFFVSFDNVRWCLFSVGHTGTVFNGVLEGYFWVLSFFIVAL